MDLPVTLKIIISATCAAVFLGTLRVRPLVVGCLAMLAPPFVLFADFNGPRAMAEGTGGEILPWIIFVSVFAAAPAFLVGSAAAFLGEWLTKGRNEAPSKPED